MLVKSAATLAASLGDHARLDYYSRLLPKPAGAAGAKKK
jgi:hypothetical protein